MNTIELIELRLIEIDQELKSYPKCKAGDYLQLTKWSLYVERRNLLLRIQRLKGTSHTLTQAIKFINERGGICEKCGDNRRPTIDHIIPISKGGSDGLENLRVLCNRCNSAKGNRIEI